MFVPAGEGGADSAEHLKFLRGNASCKGAWDADLINWDEFVEKAMEKDMDNLFTIKQQGVDGDENEEGSGGGYEWMRELQASMESDTKSKEVKKEALATPEKAEKDVSAFFNSLLAK